jgi:hypothetical protein
MTKHSWQVSLFEHSCFVIGFVMSSEVETSLVRNPGKRFESLTSRSLTFQPSRRCRGFPQPLHSPLRGALVEMTSSVSVKRRYYLSR